MKDVCVNETFLLSAEVINTPMQMSVFSTANERRIRTWRLNLKVNAIRKIILLKETVLMRGCSTTSRATAPWFMHQYVDQMEKYIRINASLAVHNGRIPICRSNPMEAVESTFQSTCSKKWYSWKIYDLNKIIKSYILHVFFIEFSLFTSWHYSLMTRMTNNRCACEW